MPNVTAKRKNKSKISFKIGLGLLGLGTLLILTTLTWKTYRAGILSFNLDNQISSSLSTNFNHDSLKEPKRLLIPKVNIDIPIISTKIHGQIWEIPKNSAGHLNISAYPGESGRIIIYGHNTNSVLGPIRWLKNDDVIVIQGADQSATSYQIISTAEVKPDQLEVLAPTVEETLTLYTCTGLFDSKRFVIQAKRKT